MEIPMYDIRLNNYMTISDVVEFVGAKRFLFIAKKDGSAVCIPRNDIETAEYRLCKGDYEFKEINLKQFRSKKVD